MNKLLKEKNLKYKQQYGNMWVAKDQNTGKVIDASSSLTALVAKMVKAKKKCYKLEKVLPANTAFIS